MTSILFARLAGWRASHGARRLAPAPAVDTARDPHVPTVAPPVIAQAEALDRCSTWPARRIRCSLPDPRPVREKSR